MIKQRIASLGLGLALLGSLVGFAGTANAADNDSLTVSATVVETLVLELNRTSVDFGANLNFLGHGAGADVVAVCTDSNDTGITGARFVGPAVTATVWSSNNYDIDRSAVDNNANASDLLERGWVVSPWVNCADSADQGTSLQDVVANPNFVTDAPFASGATHTEHYMLDVLVNSQNGTYSGLVTYTVSEHV